MNNLLTGVVTQVTAEGVWVEIRDLAPHHEFGPMEIGAFELTVGDRVLVGQVSGSMEDLVVIGPLLMSFTPIPIPDAPPANARYIYYYENTAARTADTSLVLVSGLATWLDDEGRLEIYTDEGTPGWVDYRGVRNGFLPLPQGTKIGVGVTSPTATLDSRLTAATDGFLAVRQSTVDTTDRFTVDGNGQLSWGSGSTAADSYIKRTSSNGLRINPRVGIGVDPASNHSLLVQADNSVGSMLYLLSSTTGSNPFINFDSTSVATPILSSRVSADTIGRYAAYTDGKMEWGPGGSTSRDTTLKRTSAGGMRIDNRLGLGNDPDATHVLYIAPASSSASAVSLKQGQNSSTPIVQTNANQSTTPVLQSTVTTDTNPRLAVDSAGIFTWGPGNAAVDTTLKRTAVGGIRADSRLGIGNDPDATQILYISSTASGGSAAYLKQSNSGSFTPVVHVETAGTGTPTLGTFVTGDSSDRFSISAAGAVNFGPGNASRDASITRTGTGELTIDSSLKVNTTVKVAGADLGRGFWTGVEGNTDTSSITGTSETVVLSTPSTTFKANRAYKIVFDQRWASAVATASIPVIAFRKTGLGGQQLTDLGREQFPASTSTYHFSGSSVFTVGGSDVTAVIAQTITPSANIGLIQKGAGGFPRAFEIYDIGLASDHALRPVLV